MYLQCTRINPADSPRWQSGSELLACRRADDVLEAPLIPAVLSHTLLATLYSYRWFSFDMYEEYRPVWQHAIPNLTLT